MIEAFSVRDLGENSTTLNDSQKPAGAPQPAMPSTSQVETVGELRCSQVRWFHARARGGKEHWEPFCGRDSLLIEVAYRLHHGLIIDVACPEAIVKQYRDEQVSVLGGLYKLNLIDEILEPIYVEDVMYAIRRGTWFTMNNWQPLSDDTLTLVIEREHMQQFRGQPIPTQPASVIGKRPVVHMIKHKGYKVEWSSVTDIHLVSSGIKGKLLSVISKNATPLARGYKEEAQEMDRLKPIGHLIFVIPGVGQKKYPKAIIENTGELRDMVKQLYDRLYDEREKTRPLLLPVEWRTQLTLDGGNIDLITPRYLDTYRDKLNTTALDLMYYMSPVYGQEIFTAVVDRMNDLRARFLRHNPSFNGKVSIIGHSLGAVIAYDIVQRHSPSAINLVYNEMFDWKGEVTLQVMEQHKASVSERTPTLTPLEMQAFSMSNSPACNAQLNFDVDTLICLGSPLAVFLQMRQTPQHLIIPRHIKRMFNMFHPCDMVAYRIEPLLSPHYSITKPVKLDWVETILKQKYIPDYDKLPPTLQSMKKRQKHDRLMMTREGCTPIESPDYETAEQSSMMERSRVRSTSFVDDDESSNTSRDTICSGSASPQQSNEHYPLTFDEVLSSYGEDKALPHRYDYVLRQGRKPDIVKAIRAHFLYWTSPETALFILYALYGGVGESKATDKENNKK